MGEVYRAHDPRLGRDVAIKVLPQHLTGSAEERARFEREARTISQLNHPHICTLHDLGQEDGVDYLVMELVEGETLAHRLEKGPFALAEVLHVTPGTIQNGRSRITPDGSAVVYIYAREDGQPMLLRRPLSAWKTGVGKIDTLFAGSTESIESFGLAPDGKRTTVSVVDWLSGLIIAEGVNGIVPPKRGQ
jgi:protein kinase-like protein